MSGLKDYIAENIVKPQMSNLTHPVKAMVMRLNDKDNRADIFYKDALQDGGITQLFDVPIQLGSGGSKSAGPFPGDEVWVTFGGGDVKRPQITALVDENYKNKTRETRMKHLRKGSLVPDMACGRENW